MQRSLDSLNSHLKILMLPVPLLALAACEGSIQSSTEPPRLEPAPDQLTEVCVQPVRLPDRALSQAEVEALWLRDRRALIECGLTKSAVVAFYVTRDALLKGLEPS